MYIRIEDLYFIDFEASGLSEGSWPIEIGLAWIKNFEAHSSSFLIRPHKTWSMEEWSAASSKIHNISMESLDSAPPAEEVASIVAGILRNRYPVSDVPGWEALWMTRLMETIEESAPPFLHFNEVVENTFRDYPEAHDRVYEKLERLPVPHRAGPDALRMATAVLRGLEIRSAETKAPGIESSPRIIAPGT